jgi:hypothetical protein
MKKSGFLLVVILGLIIACNKQESIAVVESQTFEINSTSSSAWKYFSFAKNDTISVSDPATSSEWDLAFQRYRIKTNGGKSGIGMGSAANFYKKGQTGFDALSIVSDTATFVTDDSVEIMVQGGYTYYVVNPVLYTWFTYEGQQIVPKDYIYIVKSGAGKYAKVWFKSYYSTSNTSGYVTFQYKYQPDGSKRLE